MNYEVRQDKAHELFTEIYNSLPEITPSSSWDNGTGYLDNACYAKVPSGRFVDSHGRAGVLINTPGGEYNIVIFERYSKGEKILVANTVYFSSLFGSALRHRDLLIAQEILLTGKVSMKFIENFIAEEQENFIYSVEIVLEGIIRSFDLMGIAVTK